MNKIILLLLLFSSPAYAVQYENIVVDKVISVTDGDTFKINIAGYPNIIGRHMPIRIKGIDTPEMKDKRPKIKKLARQAKAFAASRLLNGKKILLTNIKRGQYFRIVATVWIDGVNLGDELIKHGLAKRYGGGKKSKW